MARGPAFLDVTGQRFGRLLAIKRGNRVNRETYWICRCDCGSERLVLLRLLRDGKAKSCGCFRRERTAETRTTHGMSSTRTYRIWAGMLQRCHTPTSSRFAYYGGRGIRVCEQWLSFDAFLADMGEAPPDRSLDRIDNDGNYEPGNCRWATKSEQNANQRRWSMHHDKAMT